MFCIQCGKPVPDGARFCPFCGSAIEVANSPGTPTPPPFPNATPQEPVNNFPQEPTSYPQQPEDSYQQQTINTYPQQPAIPQQQVNNFPQDNNQKPILSKKANLQRGAEFVGGHIDLYPDRLYFNSHSFNIQTGATTIMLADIVDMGTELIPTMFWVKTRQGEKHTLVVWSRKEVMDTIRFLKTKL